VADISECPFAPQHQFFAALAIYLLAQICAVLAKYSVVKWRHFANQTICRQTNLQSLK